MDTTLIPEQAAGRTTRRTFLQSGGALVVGFTLPLTGRAAAAASSSQRLHDRPGCVTLSRHTGGDH